MHLSAGPLVCRRMGITRLHAQSRGAVGVVGVPVTCVVPSILAHKCGKNGGGSGYPSRSRPSLWVHVLPTLTHVMSPWASLNGVEAGLKRGGGALLPAPRSSLFACHPCGKGGRGGRCRL